MSVIENGAYLEPRHRRELVEASGIAPEVVSERGYRTTTLRSELERLGFSERQRSTPSLIIPMYGPAGELTTHQIKPDEPRTDGNGKVVKYETPSGSGIHLDVHPRNAERVKDASVPLWVVEGVKKADALTSRGECAVALQGVWCWQRDGTPLAGWEVVRLHSREVFVAFDSDVKVNWKVRAALEALVEFLRRRGATARVVHIPEGRDGSKVGVDDYLASGGTVAGLKKLVRDGIRLRGSKSPEIITAAALAARQLPEVQWTVPGVLPEGVTLLAGKPKLGKSWLALGLAIAVGTGGVALGTERVEQGEALYLALEDNYRRLQQRLSKLLAGGVAPSGLHFTTEWPRADEGGIEVLEGWLWDHPDARLVVIDTLARFKPRSSRAARRTQYDEDRDAVDPLIPIAAEHNVAIVLVHHLRETESEDPLDMIHGSAGLTGGVDGALVLKRRRGDADAYLTVEGRDIEASTELALKWDSHTATWAIMGDAEDYRMSETRRAIIKVLEDADQPLGPKDVADAIDLKESTARQRLYHMSEAGEIKKVARGLYAPHNDRNFRNVRNEDVTEVTECGTGQELDATWPRHPTGCRCETCSSRAFRKKGAV